jgi:CheY-like chemotaxis protein
MRILIADDTAADRVVLRAYLQQLGHEVVEALDGA